MANPTLAILGRPNVGKSTLFNRFVGKRVSIVSPIEGVTRDRIHGEMDWCGHKMNVIDTGGYLPNSDDVIEKAVRFQAEIATQEADILLLMVDARSEITSSDRVLAEYMLKSEKPFILVANKVDDVLHEMDSYLFYELGLGEPFVVSAVSGRNVGDLLDKIVEMLPASITNTDDEKEDEIKLAIVGMPNVGKSSLMNSILQEEKSIVTDIAGTTRDSIDSYFKYYGKTFRIIDTAGLRRKAKIGDTIEFYSTVRTNRVIIECDVAIVMLDASKGFGNQDRDIARLVIDKGKGLVLVVNKWDTIEKDTHTVKKYKDAIEHLFKSMEHYPLLFISVKNNLRTWKVMEVALKVSEEYSRKVSTSQVNEFIANATAKYPPPAVGGKHLKIKYGTQVHHSPPVFAFFTNYPEVFPVSYRRYLENQLRESFGFYGSPIKISFRKK
ncbi:MAG: ribosome biogenesis GTPase Der [FCB group bacterium]|nr:ribosome biogenesis GTPase Der [FCB group bacterium]